MLLDRVIYLCFLGEHLVNIVTTATLDYGLSKTAINVRSRSLLAMRCTI